MAPQSSDRMKELFALSAEIGDPAKDYVILSEGNTSARISERLFWVKGSGVRLQQANGPQAFVAMELEPLMHALRSSDQAVRLFGREDERVRRQYLAQAPDGLTTG